jgi:uncharacterized protein YqeY
MSVLEQLQSDVKDAMRARDTELTTALRLLVNAIQQESKSKLRDLDDTEEIAVLSRERKQAVESAEGFESGGADERAAAARKQVELIDRYLPAQLSADEVEAIVDAAIADTGAASPKDMGKVMGAVRPKTAGRYDGKALSQLVQEKLKALA